MSINTVKKKPNLLGLILSHNKTEHYLLLMPYPMMKQRIASNLTQGNFTLYFQIACFKTDGR